MSSSGFYLAAKVVLAVILDQEGAGHRAENGWAQAALSEYMSSFLLTIAINDHTKL